MEYRGMGLAVVIVLADLTAGAGNGEPCQTDSECTVTNQWCRGLGFYTPDTCNRGQCTCKDGYKWDVSKCKTKKYNGEACVDADDKCVTGTCSSGYCSCAAGTTYNSNLENCLTDGKKLLGETCSANDCYGSTGTVKCDTTCKCETGYIEDNYVCRAPHVGEACIATDADPSGVACASLVTSDPSVITETCVDGFCACPSGSTFVTKSTPYTTYIYCLNNYSGTQKDDGATCTAHNSCMSYFCGTCPGDGAKTCLRENSASRNLVDFSAMMTAILVFLI